MKTLLTIGELRDEIAKFNDNDDVVVEIHEGERQEDLYFFYIDVIEGVKSIDGGTKREIRLCI